MSEVRLSWDKYFMNLAHDVSLRSTCIRRKVGAIAVDKKNMTLCTGYNGTPSGQPHCTPETCLRNMRKLKSGEQPEVTRAIHAEQNIVATIGGCLTDATVYCTTRPCVSCLKSLVAAGTIRIVWEQNYEDRLSHQLMDEWGEVNKTDEGYYEFIKK